MKTRRSPAVFPVLIVLAVTGSSPSRSATTVPPGQQALDQAFRFASAIRTDPRDMDQAQEGVVQDYAAIGAWEAAAAAAQRMQGWRRGTATADLATLLARAGKKDEAHRQVEIAEAVRVATSGWQERRIAAYVAQALATLGETERAITLASDVARGDREYQGRAASTLAAADATAGRFDAGMSRLAHMAGDSDLETAWWRTSGFLGMAQSTGLTAAQRRQALDAARTAADQVPGWKKAEALESIAEEYRTQGHGEQAREALSAATSTLEAQPDTLLSKAALLSELGSAWGEAGEPARGARLLDQAGRLIPAAQEIERPALYAHLAAGWHLLGNPDRAWAEWDRALTSAADLVNARPRALAITQICRSIGRRNVPLTSASQARLDTLYAGLRDPW